MDHAAAMRAVFERINAGDIDGFGALMAPDFVEHEELPGFAPDRDGVVAFFKMFTAAFPDLRMNPDAILVDGDTAVARVTATGTHQGEFMGVPATGRPIDVQVIDIIRFLPDGMAAEHWGVFDALGLMQQIGAVPAGPPA
ncbi:MAG: ester cyclase [Thermoleophilia bacterium]